MSVGIGLPIDVLFVIFSTVSSSVFSSTFSVESFVSPVPDGLRVGLSKSGGSGSSVLSPIPVGLVKTPISTATSVTPPPFTRPSGFMVVVSPVSMTIRGTFTYSPTY